MVVVPRFHDRASSYLLAPERCRADRAGNRARALQAGSAMPCRKSSGQAARMPPHGQSERFADRRRLRQQHHHLEIEQQMGIGDRPADRVEDGARRAAIAAPAGAKAGPRIAAMAPERRRPARRGLRRRPCPDAGAAGAATPRSRRRCDVHLHGSGRRAAVRRRCRYRRSASSHWAPRAAPIHASPRMAARASCSTRQGAPSSSVKVSTSGIPARLGRLVEPVHRSVGLDGPADRDADPVASSARISAAVCRSHRGALRAGSPAGGHRARRHRAAGAAGRP